MTQSRSVWRSMPAAWAASSRLMPSSALAIARMRRATRVSLSPLASLRSTVGVRSLRISSAAMMPSVEFDRGKGITNCGSTESLPGNDESVHWWAGITGHCDNGHDAPPETCCLPNDVFRSNSDASVWFRVSSPLLMAGGSAPRVISTDLVIEETPQDRASIRWSCLAAHVGIRWSWRCCRGPGWPGPQVGLRPYRSHGSREHVGANVERRLR